MLMRGGTSKGAYILSDDLPSESDAQADLLERIMGSPDARQIDGVGGAHPLTSKVAIVGPSHDPRADVDYLFLQVGVDGGVSGSQNCGNLLAGVGPFALERGLIRAPASGRCSVRILMRNTGTIAVARFPTVDGSPEYAGDTTISGVPGMAAAVELDFQELAGGSCGAMLPTGKEVTVLDEVPCTLIDNGMPVVVLRASDVGVTGYETCAELETNELLRHRLERIRLEAGHLMNLGDVTDTTVPKLTLVAPPTHGGHLATRTFIPHRCHDAIGVLGAVSVATAAVLPYSVPRAVLRAPEGATVLLEHPTGFFDTEIDVVVADDGSTIVRRAGIVRTARKLMDGTVFPRPHAIA